MLAGIEGVSGGGIKKRVPGFCPAHALHELGLAFDLYLF